MTRARATAPSAGGDVVYAYGVTRRPRRPDRLALAGIPGILPRAVVRGLAQGDLTVFVSLVPESAFAAPALRGALADAQWLRARILAHEAALEALRARHPLLPCRFATIYRDLGEAGEAVARHRDALHRALDRVENATEWGVKLFCDRTVLGRWIELSSATVEAQRRAIAGASTGIGYFLKKKLGEAVDREAEAAVAGCLARSRVRLGACAREAADVPLQPPTTHGHDAAMVLNAAYLVDDAKLSRFRRALAGLRKGFSPQGFDYELTGPWPPYHFVAAPAEAVVDG